MLELKCEICYDWCRRLEVTKQWWEAVRNDCNLLKGTDLPTYVAILAVHRETTIELFDGIESCRGTRYNHSAMHEDKKGYALSVNQNCKFVPLTKSQREKWWSLYQTIQAFRNGAIHYLETRPMNPFFKKLRNPEDSFQNYYRYAPSPKLENEKGNPSFTDEQLRSMHQLVNPTILDIIRTDSKCVDGARVVYEFQHVERGQFVDLLHEKMTELFRETSVL